MDEKGCPDRVCSGINTSGYGVQGGTNNFSPYRQDIYRWSNG
jgi:hypothetical protein